MYSCKNRTVAVTGATGFLGYHAVLELRRHGAEVVALTRASSDVRRLLAAGVACRTASLGDPDSLVQCLRGCEFVVHAAAAVGFDGSWEHYHHVNVQGTRNLLTAARKAKVRRVLHISSIVAVGASPTHRPLDETACWNLLSRRVPYVTTKRRAEEIALQANDGAMEVVVVNPASALGPDDFTGSEFGILSKRFWKGRIPFHFGGGNNFVDVRDVAGGMRLALECGRAGERYLLTGENRTYTAFFSMLARCAGRTIPRLRLPSALAPWIGLAGDRLRGGHAKPGGHATRPYLTSAGAALMGLFFFYDARKAREELGYRARPLAQTLADTHVFWMTNSRGVA